MKVAALDLSLEGFSAPHKANYTEQINQFQPTAIYVKRRVLVHGGSIYQGLVMCRVTRTEAG